MKQRTQLWLIPLLCAATALVSLVGYDAVASRGMFAQPSAVAVIRIKPLLEGLQQRADDQVAIEALQAELTTQGENMKAEFEALRESYDAAPVGSRARSDLADALSLKSITMMSWEQNAMTTLDIESAKRLERLYAAIRSEAAKLAAAQGWNVVMVDDSASDISTDPSSQMSRELQVLRQVSARKFIFADNATDITEELLVKMNNTFAKGTP